MVLVDCIFSFEYFDCRIERSWKNNIWRLKNNSGLCFTYLFVKEEDYEDCQVFINGSEIPLEKPVLSLNYLLQESRTFKTLNDNFFQMEMWDGHVLYRGQTYKIIDMRPFTSQDEIEIRHVSKHLLFSTHSII